MGGKSFQALRFTAASAALTGGLIAAPAQAEIAPISFDLARVDASAAIGRRAEAFPAGPVASMPAPLPPAAPSPTPRSQRLGPPIEVKASRWSSAEQRARKQAEALEYTFHALNIADAALTARCLDRGRCREANPLMGRNPSPLRLIGVKLLMSGLHYASYRELIDSNPRKARLVNMISVGVMAGVTSVGIAVNY